MIVGPMSANCISWFAFSGILYRGHNLIKGDNYHKHILLKMVQGDLFGGGQHDRLITHTYMLWHHVSIL